MSKRLACLAEGDIFRKTPSVAMKSTLLALLCSVTIASGANPSDYVNSETIRIEQSLPKTLADFTNPEARARRQAEAFEMFGLSPMPERTDLKPVVTGRLEHADRKSTRL